MIFKPGDKVRCALFGNEVFTLAKCTGSGPEYSTYFIRDGFYHVTPDGRLDIKHTDSVLDLIERDPVARRRVKKKGYIGVWANRELEKSGIYSTTGAIWPKRENLCQPEEEVIHSSDVHGGRALVQEIEFEVEEDDL